MPIAQPSTAPPALTELSADRLVSLLKVQAHLWLLREARPSDGALDPELMALLSTEERGRLERLRVERERQRFLEAHAFQRLVLARYLDVTPEALRFIADADGRPGFAAGAAGDGGTGVPGFSLSHTAGCTALLVSAVPAAGVDVQAMVGVEDPLQIAATYCAPEERTWLAALAPELRRERFFDLWALREAYLKACGTVDLPPQRFAFELERGGAGAIRVAFATDHEDDVAAWQFTRFRPSTSHALAVALRRGAGQDDLEVVSWATSDTRSLLEREGAR